MRTAKTLTLALCVWLLLPDSGTAQELTMGNLKSPQELTGDELRQLVTEAKVTHKARHGATRNWYNNADGKFTASTDAVGYKGRPTAYPTTGSGVWHISPLDQYCVTIEWKTAAENWCVFIYKSGDKFYGTGRRNDPAARAVEFGFSK